MTLDNNNAVLTDILAITTVEMFIIVQKIIKQYNWLQSGRTVR